MGVMTNMRKIFKGEKVGDTKYDGVLVRLEDAVRDKKVAKTYSDQSRTSSELDRNASKEGEMSERDMERGTMGERERKRQGPNTIEGLRWECTHGKGDTAYELKSRVINKAIQDIGMGRYNKQMFILCGFGWFADNLWLQGVALTLPSLSAEFDISTTQVRYTTCSLFIGLCLGASIWGVGSDVWGRRLAFNATLFLAGVFGIAAGAAPTWIRACALFACLGLGVGGNLPVDGALFLEFLPDADGRVLTLLSVWWPVGQFIASLLAWGFMGSTKYTVSQGWRYFIYTIGAITFVMFLCRFLIFELYESPKYLLSRGRQAEAVSVVHGLAFKNGKKTWLTEDILNEIGGPPAAREDAKHGVVEIIKDKLSAFSGDRIKPLFRNRILTQTTLLLWFCWLTIGLGYPLFNAFLPQYLSQGRTASGEAVSSSETYRNYLITSAVGVPGSFLAWWTVDLKYIGRRGTMGVATLLSGIFLFLFTISPDSKYQLAFSSIEAFFQNIMYGVLYAYTPEVFPAPVRGTATGICSFLNRIAGLCAPIIAANVRGGNANAPVFVSGALILAAFVAMCGLPVETRGMERL